jgi:hypothetical protein
MKNLKKALVIASLIEVILGGIWIWLVFTEGHSGLFLGGFFHLPGFFLGGIIGEALGHFSGAVSVMACLGISIVLQGILLTFVFFAILERFKTKRQT